VTIQNIQFIPAVIFQNVPCKFTTHGIQTYKKEPPHTENTPKIHEEDLRDILLYVAINNPIF
jgi:hypothetical protein